MRACARGGGREGRGTREHCQTVARGLESEAIREVEVEVEVGSARVGVGGWRRSSQSILPSSMVATEVEWPVPASLVWRQVMCSW